MSKSLEGYKIATIGSHSALQILKGARDEGFETICICKKRAEKVYRSFNLVDQFIILEDYENDFEKIEERLIELRGVIIPHGSLIGMRSTQEVRDMKSLYYGTKGILEWESDRNKEREWLTKADLKLPNIYKDPSEIDRPVIIKFNGAQGGKDYFIANSEKEFYVHMENYKHITKGYLIQEYIVGVPVYCHYFYSKLNQELEIMGFDKRYESNADSIGRIASRDQLSSNINTSYTITGNIPLVVRESLLPEIYEIGERVVETSKEIEPGGLYGPFCLEGIIDPNLNFYIFEISARIVAGTNPFINGSPYTWLKYDEDMSTGRRVAREIKQAIELDKLDLVVEGETK
jgi:5-formaminoimidazole-4-carboxamide-1-(beta)-D-ribofuranosyl 5'-monophosphate synthetase